MGHFAYSSRFGGGADDRWMEYSEQNRLGESLLVHVVDCWNDDKVEEWYEAGLISEKPSMWLDVTTYVTWGGCVYGGYNPTCHLEDGRYVLDFDWLLEANEYNERKVLLEIERRFMEA